MVNVKGVKLNKKSLHALRLMQSEDSEMINLYLSAIDKCEEVLLIPPGIVLDLPDSVKLETLRRLRYLKKDLSTLICESDE